MVSSRRIKTYSDFQIYGMRATAEFVKGLREAQPYQTTPAGNSYNSMRGWIWWINDQTNRLFNLRDIARYESAGRPGTQGQINMINDEYLFSITQMADFMGRPLQSFTEKDLICLYNGCVEPLEPSIEDWVSAARADLGEKKLVATVKASGLSQEDWLAARHGLLIGSRTKQMAEVLDCTERDILNAGKVQLYRDAVLEHCSLASVKSINKQFISTLKSFLPNEDLESLLDDAGIEDPFHRERILDTFDGERAALNDIFLLASFMRFATQDEKWDALKVASLMLPGLDSIDVATSTRV